MRFQPGRKAGPGKGPMVSDREEHDIKGTRLMKIFDRERGTGAKKGPAKTR